MLHSNPIRKPVLLLCLLLCIAILECIGQSQPNPASSSLVGFSGQVHPASQKVDSIVAVFKKSYLFNTIDQYTLVKTVKPDQSGRFYFKLPLQAEAGKISQLQIYSGNEHFISSQYLVEKSDQVHFDINIKNGQLGLKFSGKGGKKYNFRRTVELKYNQLRTIYSNMNSGKGITDLHVADSIYIDWSKALTADIDRHQTAISPLAYQVLKTDASSKLPFAIESIYRRASDKASSSSAQKNIALQFTKYMKAPIICLPKTYTLSYLYLDQMIQRIQTLFYLKSRSYSIKEVFIYIQDHHQGVLRDRLYMQLLANPAFRKTEMSEDGNDYEACLQLAVKEMNDPLTIAEIQKKRNTLQKGLAVYNFHLTDKNGDTVSLNQFRGKVILLDLWFTGCSACLEFNQRATKEVYPKFAQDEGFKVVSVSIDKNKAQWLKSVQEGKYTNSSHVNLYTNGLGEHYPLLKHYEIRALPFLLLIDKHGKLFSRLSASTPSAEVESLIRRAMAVN